MTTHTGLKKSIPIGIVLSLIGYVALIGPDGLQKLLQLGDVLHSDDYLKTGPDGDAVVGFVDGSSLELGGNANAVLDAEVFDPSVLGNFPNLESALNVMRQNIMSGMAPSLVLQTAESDYVLSEGGSNVNSVDLDSQATSALAPGQSPDNSNTTGSEFNPAPVEDEGPVLPEAILPKVSIASMRILEPVPGKREGEGEIQDEHGGESSTAGHTGGEESGHEAGAEATGGSHETGELDAGHESEEGGHEGGSGGDYSAGHASGYGYAGGSLATIAAFTVSLSAPASHDVKVDFTTVDGTAISGGVGVSEQDYGKTSGTLIIPAGQTSGTIEVTVYADHLVENDETFLVQLFNPVNAIIGDDTAIGTIIDSGHGEGDTGEGLTLVGTDGDDLLQTQGGADNLDGLAGNDTLIAGGGPDVVHGGPGDDMIVGLGGPDQLFGDEGNDEIIGHGGSDLIDGGAGDDIIYAGGAPDTVYGGEGNDFINAEGGPDIVDAGPGNDTVYGGGGPDTLLGGEGDDSIYGQGGPDFLQGGSGNDALYGGGGGDILQGGEGSDVLQGGGGGDVFRFEHMNEGIDRIVDFDQNDKVDISAILEMETGGPISRYVQITPNDADISSYELSVNPTGSDNPADFQTLLVFENMQVAPDVDELVSNGNLIVIE